MDRLTKSAEEAGPRGYRRSALELILHAKAFYSASYHPHYRALLDPHLLTAARKQIDVPDRGLALSNQSAAPMRVPFESTATPAYIKPVVVQEHEVAPS